MKNRKIVAKFELKSLFWVWAPNENVLQKNMSTMHMFFCVFVYSTHQTDLLILLCQGPFASLDIGDQFLASV